MRPRHDPFARFHAQTQRFHDQTAALLARTGAMRDKAHGQLANTPGPLLFLDSRRWARHLGNPLQGPLTDTPTQADQTILLFPDGRTLDLTNAPDGLWMRKGLLWPARAQAFAPTAEDMVAGWTRVLVRWDSLESLGPAPVAHVTLQRRAPPPATPTTVVLQAQAVVGRARVAHRLWCADVAWTIGGAITVQFHPHRPNDQGRPQAKLEAVWAGEDLQPIAQGFAHQHPNLDRFERTLGWMVFGRWCGWPLLGTDHAPIWLGVTPSGGIA
jgi:hypothetical protein